MNKPSNGASKRGTPYIPSYMHTGPEMCRVCGDGATGYHYRCMTCEGCKGFFRRTVQKKLEYECKGEKNCSIDKTSRNQCAYCRYQKCVNEGMALDLVLSDNQRTAKKQLIEDNRERRKTEQMKTKIVLEVLENKMTSRDRAVVQKLVGAYISLASPSSVKDENVDIKSTARFAELMTPAVTRLIEFSRQIPGFVELLPDDQMVLLKGSCLEVLIFRMALRYDRLSNAMILSNGQHFTQNMANSFASQDFLLQPLFNLSASFARVFLDDVEIALLLGLIVLSDRIGLRAQTQVQELEDCLFGALRRYGAEQRPAEPNRFGKLMLKIMELRTVCTLNSEKIMKMKLDGLHEVPTVLLETILQAAGWPSLTLPSIQRL